MKRALLLAVTLAGAAVLAGCRTPLPPGAERGPDHTMAYDVLVDATPPGARIEADGQLIGNTPVHLKIFGDPNGMFHDFGSYYFVMKAYPLTKNQFAQVQYFRTGRLLTPHDPIPARIYFDMNLPSAPPPLYVYPTPGYYGPPGYYGWPYYYWDPYWGPYWGPDFRFYIGPRFPRDHRWR